MMTKKAQVVMLPTTIINKPGDICKFPYGLGIAGIKDIGYPVQHLYFITDEEIKANDWYVLDIGDRFGGPLIRTDDFPVSKEDKRKIIASTDPALGSYTMKPGSKEFNRDNIVHPIAKIPTDFIEAYVRAYNEGHPISEVLVEIEVLGDISMSYDEYHSERLKLRSNGTVIIHKVPSKTYSRNEVIDLLREFDAYASEQMGMATPDGGSWFTDKYPE